MKAYVAEPQPEKTVPEQATTPYKIEYSKQPVWKMEYSRKAESECANLNSMNAHVGQHYCRFSVEQLSTDEYAIVCLSHPD